MNWTRTTRIAGTCRMGQIEGCSYSKVVSILGEPEDGDGCKVDVEWGIVFDDGRVATIYNWKNGPVAGGPPVRTLTRWNIGGNDGEVAQRLIDLLS